MTEYETIKQEYANGERKLNEGEYIGENGLPYCSKCHTPKWCIVGEEKTACPIRCKCQEEAAALVAILAQKQPKTTDKSPKT